MNRNLLYSTVLFFYSAITAQICSAALAGEPLALEVAIHVVENSGWTSEEIDAFSQHARRAYGECGIELSFYMISVADPDGRYQHLGRRFDSDLDLEITRSSKVSSALNVYLTKFHDGILGPEEGTAVRWVPDDHYLDLLQTVWISRDPLKALSESLKTSLPTTLSHEVGHVLGLEHSYKRHDIMDNGSDHYRPTEAISFRRKQCRRLRAGVKHFES